MTVPYTKPALDDAAQLEQRKARGMTVEDDTAAGFSKQRNDHPPFS